MGLIVSMVASSIAIWVVTFYPISHKLAANSVHLMFTKWTDDVEKFLINKRAVGMEREKSISNIFVVITIYCCQRKQGK